MTTKSDAQQIADEIQARYARNPRAFMAAAARKAKAQQASLDAAQIARLRAGVVVED